MLHVFDTCNIVCFWMRHLSISWKNLASAMPLLGPTVKHSLKAVVVHNIILVLVSFRVVMQNKCFVSHWYSIMLYCCFSPGSRCWKAQGHFSNTIYEFGIPAIQSECVIMCVCVCMQTHEHACVIMHMHEDSCIDIVHYGKHTNICIIDNKNLHNFRFPHCWGWGVWSSGMLHCVAELTDPDSLKALLRTLRSVNSGTKWNIPGDNTWNKKIYSTCHKYFC
jgi:hypothetical protein